MNEIIRQLRKGEENIFKDMLYEAIYVPENHKPYPKSIIEEPDMDIYIEDFGRNGDMCIAAELEEK